MRRAESDQHYRLKVAALQWMWNHGYRLLSAEYDLNSCSVDAFGIRTTHPLRHCIIEAKATRADFLADFQPPEKIEARKAALHAQLAELETRISALDAEVAALVSALGWMRAHDTTEGKSRIELKKQARRLRNRISDRRGWKGEYLIRFGQAHRYYVITPADMIRPDEAPGWGVIELDAGGELFTAKDSPRYTPRITPAAEARRIGAVAYRSTLNVFSLLGARWLPRKMVRLAPLEALTAAAPPSRTGGSTCIAA